MHTAPSAIVWWVFIGGMPAVLPCEDDNDMKRDRDVAVGKLTRPKFLKEAFKAFGCVIVE